MRVLAILAVVLCIACSDKPTQTRSILPARVSWNVVTNPHAVKEPITIVSTPMTQWGPDSTGHCRTSTDTLRAYDANLRWIDNAIIAWSVDDTTAYRVDSAGIVTPQRCFADSLGKPTSGPPVTASLCIVNTGCGA